MTLRAEKDALSATEVAKLFSLSLKMRQGGMEVVGDPGAGRVKPKNKDITWDYWTA